MNSLMGSTSALQVEKHKRLDIPPALMLLMHFLFKGRTHLKEKKGKKKIPLHYFCHRFLIHVCTLNLKFLVAIAWTKSEVSNQFKYIFLFFPNRKALLYHLTWTPSFLYLTLLHLTFILFNFRLL